MTSSSKSAHLFRFDPGAVLQVYASGELAGKSLHWSGATVIWTV